MARRKEIHYYKPYMGALTGSVLRKCNICHVLECFLTKYNSRENRRMSWEH